MLVSTAIRSAAKQATEKGKSLARKGISAAKDLAKSKTIRKAIKQNTKKIVAKAADVARDFVSKKISDFGSRYCEPSEEDNVCAIEEIPNNVRREASAREVLDEEMEGKPKRCIPPELRRKLIDELRLTNL